MTTLEDRDYFTDMAVLRDPYEYFKALRARGPIHRMTSRDDTLIVTGYQECLDILVNSDDFSSIITTDPISPLPFQFGSDDISDQVDAHHKHPSRIKELLVAYDGDQHRDARSLLNGMFRPTRLKENEDYMAEVADRMVRDVVAKGGCELISDVATPYVTLVIADLLGVPAEDRQKFMDVIAAGAPAGNMDVNDQRENKHPLEYMAEFFFGYVTDRRAHPRQDVLTELSTANYPDGTTPEVFEVVKAAMFLFAAGQDTSAKLLGNSMRYLTETPEMQRKLRADRSLIPSFLEETMRLEGSTKTTFRLARRTITVGDYEIKAGTKLVIALAAGNRDPRRWENAESFEFNRPKVNQHLGFGRGLHTCIGAPLARAEVRVILEKFLEYTSDIKLSPKHGKPGATDLQYEPSYIIRGLERLHIELTPA
jgi:cytochrome P450